MAEAHVRYLGAPICEDAHVKKSGKREAVITTSRPMPVGTELQIDVGNGPSMARVAEVKEGESALMRLRYIVDKAETADDGRAQPHEDKPKRKRKND